MASTSIAAQANSLDSLNSNSSKFWEKKHIIISSFVWFCFTGLNCRWVSLVWSFMKFNECRCYFSHLPLLDWCWEQLRSPRLSTLSEAWRKSSHGAWETYWKIIKITWISNMCLFVCDSTCPCHTRPHWFTFLLFNHASMPPSEAAGRRDGPDRAHSVGRPSWDALLGMECTSQSSFSRYMLYAI